MDVSNAADIIKIVTPVVTFILGSLLTLAVKNYEYGRDNRRNAVKEVLRLSRDWYTQIQQLAVLVPRNIITIQSHERARTPYLGRASHSSITETVGKFDNKVYDYVSNRLLLPDLLLNLELLKQDTRCAKLVQAVEDYLREVTTYDDTRSQLHHIPACHEPFSDNKDPDVILRTLDRKLQVIVQESAKVLR